MAHVLPVEGPRDEDGEVDDAEDAAVLGDGGALGLGHDRVEGRLDRVCQAPRDVHRAEQHQDAALMQSHLITLDSRRSQATR